MFVLFRIILTIGMIFWYSPLRQPADAGPTAEPRIESAAGEADFARLGRLVQAWENLPAEDRDAVLRSVAGRLPTIAGPARESGPQAAAADLVVAAAKKPRP